MRQILLIFCCVCGFVTASSQCDSLLQTTTTAAGYKVAYTAANGIDTLYQSVDDWCPKFVFNYQSDSSDSKWTFNEFLINRRKLMLDNWCAKRVVNWDTTNKMPIEEWSQSTMRQKSVTRPFKAHAGDTIQFYRVFKWFDRLNNALSFNRYVNPNGIAYSVELVRSSNGSRIALLDSTSFATTTGNKKPSFYSLYPSASRVRYFVPGTFDSADVFIRINTYATGTSPIPFTRYDGIGPMRSYAELGSSQIRSYNDSLQANNAAGAMSCGVSVGTSSSPKSLIISHGGSPDFDQVMILDIYGTLYWSASVPLSSNPSQVNLSTGFYIVAALNSGNVVCTKSVYLP